MDEFEKKEQEFMSEAGKPAEVPPASGSEIPPVGTWQEPYHNVGTGRKESPFADSPYVMNHAAGGSYHTQVPPAESKSAKVKKSGRKIWKRILAAVLVVALVGGSCGFTAYCVNEYWEDKTERMEQQINQKLAQMQVQIDTATDTVYAVKGNPNVTGEALTPSQVYALNREAVVAIICTVTDGYSQGTTAGSGFILSENGYVVTNHHVVEGAISASVVADDGTEYPAQIVGSDATNDLAVLKIDATGLPYVVLGSSDDAIVGDQVVAVGNALGELSSTMTVGYISGKDRNVTTDGTVISMLQTDAAINSGNSGGPLFNMYGQVIGITTAKYSGTTSSGATIEGIGFAIPIDDVKSMIEDLVEYGYITGAYLGVMVRNMDTSAAEIYGLPVGAYVEEVTPGYCAEAAGLQVKDIIIRLGDHDIETITDLTRALREFEAGDTTTIVVYRGGRELTLTVTLDEKPQNSTTQPSTEPVEEVPMPSDGDFEDWYDYFMWRFGRGQE